MFSEGANVRQLLIYVFMSLILSACGPGSTNNIKANQAPIAVFSTQITDLVVSFDATTSSDPDGSVVTYLWDFGDGSKGETSLISHSYTSAGTYTVTLTVTDNGGLKHSVSQKLVLTKGGGSISGKIILSASTVEDASKSGLLPSSGIDNMPETNIVAGEILVGFKPELAPLSTLPLEVASTPFRQVRSLALVNTRLYRAEGLSASETLQLAKLLAKRSDVRYAVPNRRFYPSAVPNDEFYSFQWHYNAINLPQAWDITKGSSSTVIAVIDTGILPHPELEGRLVAGYDFISNAGNAADGDGRDSDPTDMGLNEDTGYHGTHVAGTLGANTDNGVGVAGINWNAKISAVRVLGKQGGTTADIIDGVLWAAGINPTLINPNPADVLNLSLGGPGPCDVPYQEAFDKVIAAGKIIVVAAGNGHENAGFVSPGNCANVITVGATDFAGNRASYSNYGDSIDLMAPGGDTSVDLNNDNYVDGVLSLWKNDVSGKYTTYFYQGTSMASPHVAGVASLMKAIKPSITQTEVLTALSSTARPLTASQCSSEGLVLSATDCGAGLIDAQAALEAIDLTTPPPPPPLEGISFDPVNLNFGTDLEASVVSLINNNASPLDWTYNKMIQDADNPADFEESGISLSSSSGSLAASSSQSITISLDRKKARKKGDYHLELEFISGSESKRYPIAFTVGTITVPIVGDLESTLLLACLPTSLDDCISHPIKVVPNINSGTEANYLIPDLDRGTYWIVAWKDNDASQDQSVGDYLGYYSLDALGATAVSPPATDIDFVLEEITEGDLAQPKQASVSTPTLP